MLHGSGSGPWVHLHQDMLERTYMLQGLVQAGELTTGLGDSDLIPEPEAAPILP